MATITGTSASELLSGSFDADTLQGLPGLDTLDGYGGDDLLEGGDGADWLQGGPGNDTLASGAGPGDTLNGGSGADVLLASNGWSIGGEGDDSLSAASATEAVYLDGGAGQDTLVGGSGNDSLSGGDGTDVLAAGGGNDILDLAGGNDTADAGDGDDLLRVFASTTGAVSLLTGGAGHDTYQFLFSLPLPPWWVFSQTVSLPPPDNAGTPSAVITDFQPGTGGDSLDVDAILEASIGYAAGNPFGSSGFLRFVEQGSDTWLQWDRDGAGGAQADWVTLAVLQGVQSAALVADNVSLHAALDGSEASVLLEGTAERDTLQGGTGDDTLNGLAGDDVLAGHGGNDLLEGGGGAYEFLDGGPGDDTLLGSPAAGAPASGRMYGGTGNDLLVLYAGFGSGAAGDDTLDGSGAGMSLSLAGGAGNDVVKGGSGFDRLVADESWDALGADLLEGGAGSDTLVSYGGNDSLRGGEGNDLFMVTGAAAPTGQTVLVSGGPGADRIVLHAPFARLVVSDFEGGPGGDVIDLAEVLDQCIGFLSGSPFGTSGYLRLVQDGQDTLLQWDADGASGTQAAWTTLVTLQGLRTGQLFDANFSPALARDGNEPGAMVMGAPSSDTLQGTMGADTMEAGSSNDVVYGWWGDDWIDGGAWADELHGGAGNDTLRGGIDPYWVGGSDRLYGDAGDDVLWAVTGELYGGEGNDSLFGSTGESSWIPLRLFGGPGDDTLTGGSGNDELQGDEGANRMDAAAGNDTLSSRGAHDTLHGGAGDDLFDLYELEDQDGLRVVYGDAGRDTFILYASSGAVVIRDFDAAGGEVLDIGALIDATQGYASGNLFGPGGWLRLLQYPSETVLEWDRDGAEGTEFTWTPVVRLSYVSALGAANLSWPTEPVAIPQPEDVNQDPTDPPVVQGDAVADRVVLDEDSSVTTNVLRNDTFAGAPGGIKSVSQPTHGTVVVVDAAAGLVRYLPEADFSGADRFSYTVEAGGSSASAEVQVEVLPVNDAPTGEVLLTGQPVVGGTLQAVQTLADADGIAAGSLAWQWYADGTPLAGANGPSHALVAGEIHQAISVRASYVDGNGHAESVSSAAVTPQWPGGELRGLVYQWKSHALLDGVAVTATGEPSSGTGGSPLALRAAHYDQAGHSVTAELWLHAAQPTASLDFAVVAPASGQLGFTSALGTEWQLASQAHAGGALEVAAMISDAAGAGVSGDVLVGALRMELPAGVEPGVVSFSNVQLGEGAAMAFSTGLGTHATGGDGQFRIASLPTGRYGIAASRDTGDSGNAISSADALAALRIAVGLNPNRDPDGSGPLAAARMSPYQVIAADANGDGLVTSADALAILRMAVHAPDAAAQKWIFVDEALDLWDRASGSSALTRTHAKWDEAVRADLAQDSSVNLAAVLRGDVNGNWSASAGSLDLDLTEPGHFEALAARLGVPLDVWGI